MAKLSLDHLFVVKFTAKLKGVASVPNYLDHGLTFKTTDLTRPSRKSIRWAAKFETKEEAIQAGINFLNFHQKVDTKSSRNFRIASHDFVVLTVGEAKK